MSSHIWCAPSKVYGSRVQFRWIRKKIPRGKNMKKNVMWFNVLHQENCYGRNCICKKKIWQPQHQRGGAVETREWTTSADGRAWEVKFLRTHARRTYPTIKGCWQGLGWLWSTDFGVGVEHVDVLYYFCVLIRGFLQLWYWRFQHDVDFVLFFSIFCWFHFCWLRQNT